MGQWVVSFILNLQIIQLWQEEGLGQVRRIKNVEYNQNIVTGIFAPSLTATFVARLEAKPDADSLSL